ncbi:hypothetical protein [Rhodococcus aetherivorans]|uniref:hypothetical protein n=1 Tax=Rhodococcus aetherivorans TaxID=191292 RepID=UPI00241C2337|nr:hypothetical protein [Rhodococcus aetherivorans]WFS15169.1 hypothetical protein P9K37_09055 [Rhodococcus aetherivorans]
MAAVITIRVADGPGDGYEVDFGDGYKGVVRSTDTGNSQTLWNTLDHVISDLHREFEIRESD